MAETETPTQTAPDKRNLHQRLACVMRECTYVKKDRPEGMQYSIVSHDVVTAKVRPYLLKYGVIYNSSVVSNKQEGNRTEIVMETTFVNIDDPKDTLVVNTVGYGIDNQDKGPGKAISYATKYALLKTLALETGEDADLESIDHVPAEPERKQLVDNDVWEIHMSVLREFTTEHKLSPATVRADIKTRFKKKLEEMTEFELDEAHVFLKEKYASEAVAV